MNKAVLRAASSFVFLAGLTAHAAPPDAGCHASNAASPCVWLNGLLLSDNWRPHVHLLTSNPRPNMLWVYTSEERRAADPDDNQHPVLPPSVAEYRLLAGIHGNFLVCPLAKRPQDRHESVCISDGRDLTGEKTSTPPRPARTFPLLAPDAAEREIAAAFGFWGVVIGIRGQPTPAVAAYRSLLQAPDGAERFSRLAKTASIPGRLYALCGLALLDQGSFAAELARLWKEAQGKTVEVGLYDGSSEYPVRDVLGSPKPHEAKGPPGDGMMDLASGAPCHMLAERPLPY